MNAWSITTSAASRAFTRLRLPINGRHWVMATNPAVSLPNSTRIREALAKCPLVIVSDCVAETDMMTFAHVKLPALAWGEKDGAVTNSERCVSRQRATLPPAGEAWSDWSIIAGVATRMGHRDAFAWRNSAGVFREYARLTAYENSYRLLDLSSLVSMTNAEYDAFAPDQWSLRTRSGTPRLSTDGVFPRPDSRARMVAVRPKSPAEPTSGQPEFKHTPARIYGYRETWAGFY
ncbi:MAG: hypothetical protein EON93_11740, partial [Burkholderiales bacterium]